ncbi:MAG: HNH endonuclease [Clostridia bacterium]|nr:HNH endonuclease [Clostridia bacterium]
MMNEIWKKLVYPNITDAQNHYEISSNGRLKNLKTNRILKPSMVNTGYYTVRITLGSRNLKKHIIIHKAVAYTFLPNVYNYPEVNHKDGNKLNNNVENLEWCSSHYNQIHKYKNGLFDKNKIKGINNHESKLNNDQVKFIRTHYKYKDKTYNAIALAKMMGVSKTTIYSIIKYSTWK